ncbi:hypothetical protein [Kordia sp.]|uniref:hypothetical protein n=1 Tax=Kordia sp. TaxID=1965332 RepID=UPI003B593CE6
MEGTCRIADAMNTYNLALKIIKSKGYKIFLYPDDREEYLGDFWAIKGDREFIGGDPLRLLGIISIWENTGDDWQNNNFPEEDLYDEILSRALPDSVDDFNDLSDEKFKILVSDYSIFFKNVVEEELPENPSRQEMFEIINSLYEA